MKTFNAEEAAEFLKISSATLKILAGSGVVPGAKVGRAWVFTDEGLESYLRSEITRQTTARVEEENKHVPTAFSRTLEADAALQKAPRRRRGYIPSLSMNP
jgi:hypothetical protein